MEQETKNVLSNLEQSIVDVKTYKNQLINDLSRADQEVSDLLHYIEFNRLNACQGYKIAKMLQDCLLKRRDIKTTLEVLNRVSALTIGAVCKGKMKNAEKVPIKKYKPRVLTDLFK